MAGDYMDFSPVTGLWNYLASPSGPRASMYPELDRPTAPTPQERMRSVPKAIPYNASMGPDQNRMQPNVQAPDQSVLLDAIRRANAPINSTGNDPAVAPWVARGGSASDFAPQDGPGVGIMPMEAREAIRNHPNPWVGLGGSESDYYDPNSAREMQRQSDNAQLAKLRRIQQIFAPPSQASIEQTMQNSAMGYAPEYQRAYLQDMQSRTSDRLRAAAQAIGVMYGQDVGMRQADVESQNTQLQAGIAGQNLQQQKMLQLLENAQALGLSPQQVLELKEKLMMRIPVGGAFP